MKKLLLILPLLFWLGCEDEKEEVDNKSDFEFVNEWVQCKTLSMTDNRTDGSYDYEVIYNWDGNSYETQTNGERGYSGERNEYGITIRSESPGGTIMYQFIFDKWKVSENGWINEYGDTTAVYTYSWDGLTATQNSNNENHHNSIITYNDYGLELESWLIYAGTDSLFNHIIYNYEDDGRRLKNTTINGQLVKEYNWNANEFEWIQYDWANDGEPIFKLIGELNKYYHYKKYDFYTIVDGSWNLNATAEYEYECPGFEQIYP